MIDYAKDYQYCDLYYINPRTNKKEILSKIEKR